MCDDWGREESTFIVERKGNGGKKKEVEMLVFVLLFVRK